MPRELVTVSFVVVTKEADPREVLALALERNMGEVAEVEATYVESVTPLDEDPRAADFSDRESLAAFLRRLADELYTSESMEEDDEISSRVLDCGRAIGKLVR